MVPITRSQMASRDADADEAHRLGATRVVETADGLETATENGRTESTRASTRSDSALALSDAFETAAASSQPCPKLSAT